MSNMNEFFHAVRNAQYTFPSHITKITEDGDTSLVFVSYYLAKSFIQQLLAVDYVRRPSAVEARQHPWLKVAQTPTFVDEDPIEEADDNPY